MADLLFLGRKWLNGHFAASWIHVTAFFFLIKFSIIGCNLKSASISKIPKWPSLGLLALKSKFIGQFEFSENSEELYRKCC